MVLPQPWKIVRSFQAIEAPWGRLYGAEQIAIAGLALPEITGIVQFSWETLRSQQIANHLVSEGTVSVSPNHPALCDGVVLPSLNYRSRGDTRKVRINPYTCYLQIIGFSQEPDFSWTNTFHSLFPFSNACTDDPYAIFPLYSASSVMSFFYNSGDKFF